ncbi:MAG TPA: hypothetical protein VER36_05540 [Flavisolibacter sp.]|nr:hypothetical protein [Flavisolibacter sp.]
MKRDFTHENFEDFLKRSADSLRMKAPDKVWENLSKELNKRRRRTIIGLSMFLLISAAVGYSVISNVQPNADLVASPSKQTTHSTSPDNIDQNTSSPVRESEQVSSTAIQENRRNTSVTNRNKSTLRRIVPRLNHYISERPVDNGNNAIQSTEIQMTEQPFAPTVVDSYTEFDAQLPAAEKKNTDGLTTPAALPLTIESVINTYKAKTKKGKFETQFYFTPTISYRKLSENKSYLRNLDANAVPANYPAFYSSVNNNVTHKPDVGFELGFATKYVVSNRLKIRAGVQFNVNRYDIKAFSSPMANATIALSSGGRVEPLSVTSGYSTSITNGYKSNWLQNLSFQASVPVGAEYLFSGNDKIRFGVAATVQPTYVLNDRAYLITTDYKSYTQVDWLIRRWNVNTALETFVTYNRWQIGPQVRYQLLSSFISKYPVKENLFDFGLKVGVTLGK